MTTQAPSLRIALPLAEIAAFCQRWSIVRLEVFGSALRDDFSAESDLDLLATYAPEARWSLLDRARMKLELETMLGREVDLLNRRALEKTGAQARSSAILTQARPLYVAS